MTLSMDKTKLRKAARACLHLSIIFDNELKDPNNIMSDDRRESLERSRKMWLDLHDEIDQKITAWEEKHGGGQS